MSTKKTTTTRGKGRQVALRGEKSPPNERKAAGRGQGHPDKPSVPAPGNTLSRTFKGKNIVVKVTADGFQYEGQTFKSISAVARHITGYMISGPVFFKLAQPKATTKPEA